MKQIIFFDGDGTLWYPRKTKYKKHPVWVYRDRRIKDHLKHLTMIPSVLATIKKLKKMGIITVMLSTHPQPLKESNAIIKHKVRHFKVEKLFDEIYATRGHPKSKGEFILRVLKRRKIQKSKALMVGDSYKWDYQSAREKGVEALLIKSDYEPMVNKMKRTIEKLSDILQYL